MPTRSLPVRLLRAPRATATRALVLLLTGAGLVSAEPAPSPEAGGVVPPPTRALDPADSRAARALARVQQEIERGDLAAAERSLAEARRSSLLVDYVALFEARLMLARGDARGAATAARRGREAHAGKPVAGAFSELLGEALLAQGDEAGARGAWQVAYQACHDPDRRADLEARILASHERTGTLAAALEKTPDAVAVADGSALPPSIRRELQPQPSAGTWLERAEALKDDGRSEEAIEAYAKALAGGLAPAQARHARMERGHALFSIRRYAEAQDAFAALLPDPEARFWRARSLARSGRVPAAIRAFEAIGDANDARYGTWALYLAGTLLEDRGQTDRAMAHYERVAAHDRSERALDALWRVGWSAYGRGDTAHAREVFVELASRSEGLDALRPRYWAARAAEDAGDREHSRQEYQALATGYPLSYYGWRASQRLGLPPGIAGSGRLSPGSSRVALEDVHKVEALLLADLRDYAEEELVPIASRARGLEDRKAVGRLYWLAGDYHSAQRLVVDAYEESLSQGVQPANRSLWQLSWPAAYRDIVRAVFPEDAVIDPALVWAIMREESGYRPWVTSSAGARGLLQIMPATGEQIARRNGLRDFDPEDLYTPEVNIRLGAAYLDELSRTFHGRLSAAIGSYNAGPRAVRGWLRGRRGQRDDDVWVEDIPYKQTRSYVKRVLRSLHVYRSFYDPAMLMGSAAPVASTGSSGGG